MVVGLLGAFPAVADTTTVCVLWPTRLVVADVLRMDSALSHTEGRGCCSTAILWSLGSRTQCNGIYVLQGLKQAARWYSNSCERALGVS